MGRCEELHFLAQRNPKGLRFSELCRLAECFGWSFIRQKGSHRVYSKDGQLRPLVFQEQRGGAAAAYQVRQLLAAIERDG